MRWLWVLLLSAGCGSSAPVTGSGDTQEFIFITSSGRSFSHVLPANWTPRIEGGFLRINNRQRIMAMDVIMIRPAVQFNLEGLAFVRLARRNSSVAVAGLYDLWVRDGIQGKIGSDRSLDLVEVAPQAWLRPNDFRLVIER